MPADNRYAFLVEWLDPQAQLVRQYLLFFYSVDGTVEMDDIKNRRKFLRRCEYPGEFDALLVAVPRRTLRHSNRKNHHSPAIQWRGRPAQ